MEKTVTISLTRDEAENLSTVLTTLNGNLHYRAAKDKSGKLDASWAFWHNIEKKVSTAFGFAGWLVSNELTDNLLYENKTESSQPVTPGTH